MAGKGFPPQPARRRRNVEASTTVVQSTGKLAGPPLPEGYDWHPQTVALWQSLRRSPLLANEPELGWQYLIDTALMHHTMWTKGRWEFASEVRLRLASFGATPADRMRLKISIAGPEVKEPAKGTRGDRQHRLRVVDDQPVA
jgi:hypothetical protein